MAWWTDDRKPWQKEFDSLTELDFKNLEIEKDKLEQILEELYNRGVIR
ncbi:hypothetical protein ANABIO32_00260 [Rossellomorea marisflavi]|jgi:hypothetical protein|nr:hypothetical protein ANABIO32_00260 [Rossellomorea marisflavi]